MIKVKLAKESLILAAAAVLFPAMAAHAGTEAFVNGGSNDFVGAYAGTQDNTFLENNTTTQDNTNNGSQPYLDSKASSSGRYRFILDFDLSAMEPYASQITISNAALQLTQYNTFAFESDTYALDVAAFLPTDYGWTQATSTGLYYDSTTTPPTNWKDPSGNPVYPLNATPGAARSGVAYTQLFTQSATDPQDFLDGNPIGTQYSITDSTGAFLTAIQNWINDPTQNAGLFVQNYENSGDASNNVLQYYSDIASNPQAYRPTLVLTVSSPTMTTDWTADASDNWSNSADWDNGVASTIGATANFGDVISAQRTITLDTPEVVSNLNFSSPYGYVIAGSNTLSIIEVNNNLATMNVTAGDNTISAPVDWGTNTNVNISSGASLAVTGGISGGAVLNYSGPGPLTLSAGTLGGLNTNGGSVTLAGAMTLYGPVAINSNSTLNVNAATTVTQIQGDGTGTLNIAGGSLAPTAQAGAGFSLAGLSITGGGQLDLSNGSMTLNYSGISPLATIQNDLKTGFNSGSWNGPGIITSAAAGQLGTALGYVDTGSQVKVQFTWLGDLDLNGTVDGSDLSAMGVIPTSGPEAGLIGWFDGDLNYDGKIDQDDYSLFQLGAAEYDLVMTSPVPEPSALGLLAIGALGLTRKRRR